MQALYTAICNQRVKKRIELRNMNNHSLQHTVEEPVTDRFERSRARRTHEVASIAGSSHFTWKNTRFRVPASRPTQTHATFSRQYTAICNQTVKKRIELRQHEQPLVAAHSGGTGYGPVRAQPHPPHTHEVASIAGGSHFIWKNTRFRVPASRPTQIPCNLHAGIIHCDLQPNSQESQRTTPT